MFYFCHIRNIFFVSITNKYFEQVATNMMLTQLEMTLLCITGLIQNKIASKNANIMLNANTLPMVKQHMTKCAFWRASGSLRWIPTMMVLSMDLSIAQVIIVNWWFWFALLACNLQTHPTCIKSYSPDTSKSLNETVFWLDTFINVPHPSGRKKRGITYSGKTHNIT